MVNNCWKRFGAVDIVYVIENHENSLFNAGFGTKYIF